MSESLKQQIDRLREIYKSELDPRGRAFVPLADAHRQLGDLDEALAVIQEGLVEHPDFASAHVVLGWVYRSREEPDDAMRSFERVLALDAENTVARAAIAELIEDQEAQADRDEVAAKESEERSDDATAEDERPVVPIASLAPEVPDATIAPPAATLEVSDGDARPVVPIASLAPGVPDATIAPPAAALEVSDGDARPVVAIASLAPSEPDVVRISSLAPEGGEEAPDDDGSVSGEIYTQTLAELYAAQGAIDRAIEVYVKLIADDPDNGALQKRLDALEALEPVDGVPAEPDVRARLGALMASQDQRQTVPIESLAPDGRAG